MHLSSVVLSPSLSLFLFLLLFPFYQLFIFHFNFPHFSVYYFFFSLRFCHLCFFLLSLSSCPSDAKSASARWLTAPFPTCSVTYPDRVLALCSPPSLVSQYLLR